MIIQTATRLFAHKGYSGVTMKDICEATHLSRGGLYGHFSSTKEIFIALLDKDLEENRFIVDDVIGKKVEAQKIFFHYLEQEKQAVFTPDKGLYFAIHEFAFREPDQRTYLNNRVNHAREILEKIFRHGQKTGEFKKFDRKVTANHILYFFDSLKTSSPVLDITEEMVDKQIKLIKELIYENNNI